MHHVIQAGKLYMDVDMMKEALDMFMAGNYWDKARHIATNIAPRYEQYVEDAYVEYLKQHNKTEEVRGVACYWMIMWCMTSSDA